MNIEQAKKLDMVDYLSSLNHQPTRVSHPNYWYRSPLREEKTASFKVNRKINAWIDFPTNEGGNLVDFGVRYFKCTVSEFLEKLSGVSGPIVSRQNQSPPADQASDESKSRIKILSIHNISAIPLISYYRERRIPDVIARSHLKEASYELNSKNYYALAFPNDKGGYELRNKYFKGSSAPKDSTFINHQSSQLMVFEGFFNFLSYLSIVHRQDQPNANYLILNSTAFFKKNLSLMDAHDKVHLFLDNDTTGQNYSRQALSMDRNKFIDECQLYAGYSDLNDWHINIGKSPRIAPRQMP